VALASNETTADNPEEIDSIPSLEGEVDTVVFI